MTCFILYLRYKQETMFKLRESQSYSQTLSKDWHILMFIVCLLYCLLYIFIDTHCQTFQCSRVCLLIFVKKPLRYPLSRNIEERVSYSKSVLTKSSVQTVFPAAMYHSVVFQLCSNWTRNMLEKKWNKDIENSSLQNLSILHEALIYIIM